jgi:nucleotide-binding universal stress UspA family protein
MLPRTILVPTDLGERAERSLAQAVELATVSDATIHLLHVIVTPAFKIPEVSLDYQTLVDEAVAKATAVLETLAEGLRRRVPVGPVRVETGDPRDVIDKVAREIDADLIVMGTHGRRGVARALLGSVAESVVRTAACPVLTVRTAA